MSVDKTVVNRWSWAQLLEIEDSLRHVEFELLGNKDQEQAVKLLKSAQQAIQRARSVIKL